MINFSALLPGFGRSAQAPRTAQSRTVAMGTATDEGYLTRRLLTEISLTGTLSKNSMRELQQTRLSAPELELLLSSLKEAQQNLALAARQGSEWTRGAETAWSRGGALLSRAA